MKLSDLKLPDKVVQILEKDGITELNEPQKMAVQKGLLEKKNLVIASPTASGKTLIAELAILKNFIEGGKSVYIAPLKALASEKYEDFKKYNSLGMRTAISTGDSDSSEEWLGRCDTIVLSNEKMDSLLRHNTPWIRDVTLIVIDEIHMLDDASRGPTLEVVITKLRQITSSQVIALSATISNASDIAKWLRAKLVYSEYRPVALRKGIFYPSDASYIFDFPEFKNTQKLQSNFKQFQQIAKTHSDSEVALCMDTLAMKKQALIFVGARRSAEASAEKISAATGKLLGSSEKAELAKLSQEIENALSSPTKQCKRLSSIVKNGAAFHHAGLVAKQRKLIEDNFKAGLIKFICATSTLFFGVNLPAYRVLIRDAKRYGGDDYGSYYVPNFEIQQAMGRAGRPRYDKEGEAIILAKSSSDAEDLKERYIYAELEPIYSKLSVEPVLRMHVLALIANETAGTKKQLEKFFQETFFAYQYGSVDGVMEKVDKILEELRSFKFVQFVGGEKFISSEFRPAFSLTSDIELKATRIGKRIAELYIDPLSAKHIIDNIELKNDLAYLTAINQCAEMRPTLRVKKSDDDIDEKLAALKMKAPDVWDIEYDNFLSAFKTSLMFQDWTKEIGEDKLLERYGIAPGELYNKTQNMERMLFAARELALLLNKKENATMLNKLRLRIRYGVKEELLPLVELRGIGKARARLLFGNGLRTPGAIIGAPKERLAKILGPKIAEDIYKQLTEGREERFKEIKGRN